jgi:hypothetical protein
MSPKVDEKFFPKVLKRWGERVDEWRPAMVKMSPEAMRFIARRIRAHVVKLDSLADELEEKSRHD